MLFFKIFQKILIPSVFAPGLLFFGIIFCFKFKKQKTGKILIILGLIFYYLFSIALVADLILSPLENQYKAISEKDIVRAEKAVFLSGGGEADILRLSEILRIWQLKLKEQKELQIIISVGNPLKPGDEEGAKEIKEYLAERGIKKENIILETKARNTAESAIYIKEIVGKEPFFLVTSAYHMQRSIKIFQKIGTVPIPAPADFKIKKDYNIFSLFPDPINLEKSDLAFHEYFGIFYYSIRY